MVFGKVISEVIERLNNFYKNLIYKMDGLIINTNDGIMQM